MLKIADANSNQFLKQNKSLLPLLIKNLMTRRSFYRAKTHLGREVTQIDPAEEFYNQLLMLQNALKRRLVLCLNQKCATLKLFMASLINLLACMIQLMVMKINQIINMSINLICLHSSKKIEKVLMEVQMKILLKIK